MGDKKEEETQVQTAIRIPESVLNRFDKLAQQMSVEGTQITRADVHRQAVYRGLAELEKENKKR
jgi:predicted DNA-binding protein